MLSGPRTGAATASKVAEASCHAVVMPIRLDRQNPLFCRARHRRFEHLTYGSGVAISASAPSGSGLQPLEIVRDRETGSVQRSLPLAPNRSPFGPPVVHDSADGPGSKRLLRGLGAPLLTVRQVAERLGVCTAIVYALVGRGELAHVRVSNAIRINPAALSVYSGTKAKRSRRARRA